MQHAAGEPRQFHPIVDAMSDDPNRTKQITQHRDALPFLGIDLGVREEVREFLRSRRPERTEPLPRPTPTDDQWSSHCFPVYVLVQSIRLPSQPGDVLRRHLLFAALNFQPAQRKKRPTWQGYRDFLSD